MRKIFVGLIVVLFLATWNCRAEESQVGPPEQKAFCSQVFDFYKALKDYQDSKSKLGPIQQAQMGPPPTRQKYNDEVVKILGPTGEFRKWIGQVSVFVVEGSKAAVIFSILCKSQTPGDMSAFNYRFENFALGAGLTPAAQKAVKQGYFARPFSDPVVTVISKFPNDNMPHFAKLSGTLFYTKNGAGKSGYLSLTGYGLADVTDQGVYAAKFTDIESP